MKAMIMLKVAIGTCLKALEHGECKLQKLNLKSVCINFNVWAYII